MSVKKLSSNIIDIINHMLKNQEIVNLVGHDGNIPLESPIVAKDIAPKGKKERLYTYPFDTNYTGDVRTQIHVYYPSFEFENNANATRVIVLFDIVVHKDIWLMMDNGKKVIRAYQIVEELVNSMNGKSIGELGKIHFIEGNHTIINNEFEGIRLVAKFTEF